MIWIRLRHVHLVCNNLHWERVTFLRYGLEFSQGAFQANHSWLQWLHNSAVYERYSSHILSVIDSVLHRSAVCLHKIMKNQNIPLYNCVYKFDFAGELLPYVRLSTWLGPEVFSMTRIHDSSFRQFKVGLNCSSVCVSHGLAICPGTVGSSTLPSPPQLPRPPQQEALLTHRHPPPSYSFQ